jgi:ATP-dependent Clp protease adaptor protein ClpS
MTTLTVPERVKPRTQPPYVVIIMNDNIHTAQYVIETLIKVFGYQKEKSFKLADEIHKLGEGIVWTGSLEVAELKRDQIRSAGPDFNNKGDIINIPLNVRLEPLPHQ